MHAILVVLQKTIVQEFYRQNAGLLLVTLFIAGGFMRSVEHIALATYAIHAPAMLLGYILLWTLYTTHATRFMTEVFRANEFLLLLRLWAPAHRLAALWLIQVSLLLPVITYAGFMLTLSLQARTRIATGIIITSLLLLSTAPWGWVEYRLRHPNPDKRLSWLRLAVQNRFTTPYSLFFIRHLLHRQPVLLLLTKSGSCLLLMGVCWLFPTDDYDIRLLALGTLLTGAFHATLVYKLYQFEQTRLSLLRNLPIPVGVRFVQYSFILTLILTPELFVLLRNIPVHISIPAILSVWLFTHGLLLLLYAVLLMRHRPLDRLMPVVFWIVIGFFFLIMYRIAVWSLATTCYATAAILVVRYFYQAQWTSEADS